jgi:Kdo2-lipid IVA lauroyltransferase/acyltransferase
MKRVVWLFEVFALFILSLPIALLPLRWALKTGEKLGLLLFYVWKSRRKIAIENLSMLVSSGALQISEPVVKLIKDNFRNLGKSSVEVIKIYYGLGQKIFRSVSIEGINNMERAKSKGKGMLFLTGHCGNWELIAMVASLKLSELAVVARPLDNPYLNNIIEGARGKYGNRVIPKKGALKSIIRVLRSNGCVGILMDQAVTRNEGFITDFLGRGAWTSKVPATIARKTGAAVLPAFIHRTGRGHVIKVYPDVDLSRSEDSETAIREDTIRFSSFFEDYIREHPEEWLWIHRRWKRVKS